MQLSRAVQRLALSRLGQVQGLCIVCDFSSTGWAPGCSLLHGMFWFLVDTDNLLSKSLFHS